MIEGHGSGQLRVCGRKNLSEKVPFELTPESQEAASYVCVLGESILGKGKSLCRGPKSSQHS